MRRSAHVAAPLLASAALAMLTGCRKPEMQRCVDDHGAVVADNLCQNQPLQQNNGVPYYHPYGGGSYRWYYGGLGGYSAGTIVGGGGYAPLPGHSYASSTSRGGFGSTHAGSGEGGHGGEGGSHGGGS